MRDIDQLKKIDDRASSAKTKEERRQIEIEQSLETLSKYLDGLVKVPGVNWRFGLDSIIGLIPNFGDISTSIISFYILIAGVRYGVPKITLFRMALNIGLDYLIGVIPFVGDAFDLFWKSNKKNLDLIKKRGTGLGKNTASDWIFVCLIIAVLILVLLGSIMLSVVILGFLLKGIWEFSWTPPSF